MQAIRNDKHPLVLNDLWRGNHEWAGWMELKVVGTCLFLCIHHCILSFSRTLRCLLGFFLLILL